VVGQCILHGGFDDQVCHTDGSCPAAFISFRESAGSEADEQV
jgi:hypothetical protein